MNFIRQRPVVFWGSIANLVESVIGLLLIFGIIDWTADQVGMVMVVVSAIGQMFVFLIQGQVTPTNNPRDDAGNPLTPGPIGSEAAEDLPEI